MRGSAVLALPLSAGLLDILCGNVQEGQVCPVLLLGLRRAPFVGVATPRREFPCWVGHLKYEMQHSPDKTGSGFLSAHALTWGDHGELALTSFSF